MKINSLIVCLVFLHFLSFCSVVQGQGSKSFKRIPLQYIAALGDPQASSGTNAQSWGLWRVDPGPRGVWLKAYSQLMANGGVATAGWRFDSDDWWLEEHGLIMEQPEFPMPLGQYVVTGGRKVTAILTVHPVDSNGEQRWELANGASLEDVTHIPCRASRYSPLDANTECSPKNAPAEIFPVKPGTLMPEVEGCNKKKYAVLFVIGVASK